MRIGLIGRGRWGQIYVDTLAGMGLTPAWVSGRPPRFDADAIIIATPAETHFDLALEALHNGANVLIEKPVTMDLEEAEILLDAARRLGAVAFVDHTHLYAPSWRAFKSAVAGASQAHIQFGGPFRAPKWWCKGSHAVAMGIDLFGRPEGTVFDGETLGIEHERGFSSIHIQDPPCAVEVVCCPNGDGVLHYDPALSSPTPMEVLLTEFFAACDDGSPDIAGLELGVQVTRVLARVRCA